MGVDERLLKSLRELAALLDTVGEKHWSSWASTTADRVAAGADPSVVRRAYGGMGSLNDLIIHPVNGHDITADQVDRVNRALSALRERIYSESRPA
ncbi:DUF6966 domain-containing protein [Microbacterium xylanilyticum]